MLERAAGIGPLHRGALKGVEGRCVTYAELTETHKLWRLGPGRAARSVVRRNERPENPRPDFTACYGER